MADGTMSYFF